MPCWKGGSQTWLGLNIACKVHLQLPNCYLRDVDFEVSPKLLVIFKEYQYVCGGKIITRIFKWLWHIPYSSLESN